MSAGEVVVLKVIYQGLQRCLVHVLVSELLVSSVSPAKELSLQL